MATYDVKWKFFLFKDLVAIADGQDFRVLKYLTLAHLTDESRFLGSYGFQPIDMFCFQ
jgi:hypothetical protein